MTLTYALSRSNVMQWYWYGLLHNRQHGATWIRIVFSAFIVACAVARLNGGDLLHVVGWGMVASLSVVLFFALYPQYHFKPQTRTLTVLPTGIDTTIAGKSKHYVWTDVASIRAIDAFVVITICTGNAFMVPLAAFASPRQRDAWRQQWQEWHRQGHVPAAEHGSA